MGDFNQIDVQTAITRLFDIGVPAIPFASMVNGINDKGLLGNLRQESKFEKMLSVDEMIYLRPEQKEQKNIWSGKAKSIEISDMVEIYAEVKSDSIFDGMIALRELAMKKWWKDKRLSERFIAVTG